MNKNTATIISLDEARDTFNNETHSPPSKEIHKGFSQRFNALIDLVEELPVPSERGRRAYIAHVTGFSKPTVDEWLSKDKPPQDTNLRKIVNFMLGYIPGNYNIAQVESWLRYGEEAVSNPFLATPQDERLMSLRPLAGRFIAQAGRNLGLPVTAYSLQQVMNDTINILVDFDIDEAVDTQPAVISMIEGLILQYKK